MADEKFVTLKSLLLSDSLVGRRGNFLRYLHGIILGKDWETFPEFPVTKKELQIILSTPRKNRQFCEEVLNLRTEKQGHLRNIKDEIPWRIFYEIVLETVQEVSLLNLFDIYRKTSNSYIHMKIAELFEFYLANGYLLQLLWKQCLEKPVSFINNKALFSTEYQLQSKLLIQLFTSLPEIISNKLELQTRSIFKPSDYFTLLSEGITEVLTKIHASLQDGTDCSLCFISELFAKICAVGKAGLVYKVMIPRLLIWIKESPLWCRICFKLFSSVPDALLEACVEPLLKFHKSEKLLASVFGDEVLSRPKLKYLFTHKFLFIRMYTDDCIPLNILSYLSSTPSKENCFKEILHKLLDIWGDRSSIKHISYEQHLYISKSLLIALYFMSNEQKKTWKTELTLKLMEGVPAHLERSDEKIRKLGMIVAECLTKAVDTNGKQLKFDLERTEEVEYLCNLTSDPFTAIRTKNAEDAQELQTITKSFQCIKNVLMAEVNDESDEESELDSDDNLEPLNVEEEHETSVNGVKPPAYLRDCIAGLLSKDDPNRLEASLQVLEKLVRRQPGDLTDVSVEVIKILLHLENQYNIENFYQLKARSMVAVTVKCPKEASQYLAAQFYSENYTINQRLDMLEVISKSSILLSKPMIDNPDEYRSHLPLPLIPGLSNVEQKPEWRQIVDERIENKTRRFVQGAKKALTPVENQFNQIAGSFFFPLVKNFGMKVNTCDMLGSDSIVLGKFIYTLGIVLQCSDGLPVAGIMGKALLDLIWSLRFHKETFVRNALIYALSMISLHVPAFTLVSELHAEIIEARDWLTDISKNDPNIDCQKLATSCLVIMQKTIQQEFLGIS